MKTVIPCIAFIALWLWLIASLAADFRRPAETEPTLDICTGFACPVE